MLEIRNNLECCGENLVELEKSWKSEDFVAKIGVDTDQNEPRKGLKIGRSHDGDNKKKNPVVIAKEESILSGRFSELLALLWRPQSYDADLRRCVMWHGQARLRTRLHE